MKIRVIIEFDPVTESFAAFCPELPGCASCGDTEKGALRNFKAALKLYFEPTPFRPKNAAAGSVAATKCSAAVYPFHPMLLTSQMTAPAGRA